jgi:glutathione S-transferase
MTLPAEEGYRLYGHIGSPYSMKMRGVLRYRRIPHVFEDRIGAWARAFGQVRVPVMPVLEYPDGSFRNDSTPLILDLEERHEHRSIISSRESDAFLAALIEDLADEWLSKAMYAYRWAFPRHTGWTGRLIAFDQRFGGGRAAIEEAGDDFEMRQVGRNTLVGCTEENLPMLMEIAARVLDALEPNIPERPFLFGNRPSNAEFALFGQLTQFTLDLAAIEPCQRRAPYTMRWCHHMHYLPFLLANRAALDSGASRIRVEAHGLAYEGAPFKYQGRCLQELRRAYAALSGAARKEVDPILEAHSCLEPLRI